LQAERQARAWPLRAPSEAAKSARAAVVVAVAGVTAELGVAEEAEAEVAEAEVAAEVAVGAVALVRLPAAAWVT
jgi:hypothetical protein